MKLVMAAAGLATALLLPACATTSGDQASALGQLTGTEWIVEDIAGRGVIDNSRASLMFGPDGRLSGRASCNRLIGSYSVDGQHVRIDTSGLTMMACPPALMDQESRFVAALKDVRSYRIDDTGALILAGRSGAAIKAYPAANEGEETTYSCEDGSTVAASYSSADRAIIRHNGQTVSMTIAMSASGARYVGGGLEWWTKGTTQGTLSPLAPGETVASAPGVQCTAR